MYFHAVTFVGLLSKSLYRYKCVGVVSNQHEFINICAAAESVNAWN